MGGAHGLKPFSHTFVWNNPAGRYIGVSRCFSRQLGFVFHFVEDVWFGPRHALG